MRTLMLGAALMLSAPAFACPMADAAAFAAAAEKVQATDGSKLTVMVEGMTCGDCSNKVAAKLKKIDGVHDAAVDYQTGKTLIAFDAAKVKQATLVSAISELGYKAEVSSDS